MPSPFPENGKISPLEHQDDTKGTCKYERLLKSKQDSPWYPCTSRDQTLKSKCSRTDYAFLQMSQWLLSYAYLLLSIKRLLNGISEWDLH